MTAKGHGFLLNCGGGYTTLNILKSTELYIFKQVNFTVCELHLNKTATKKKKAFILKPHVPLQIMILGADFCFTKM